MRDTLLRELHRGGRRAPLPLTGGAQRPRVLLVRHCEAVGPAADAPLTARGAAEAVALARGLDGRGIDRVVSSPHRRVRETIAPFAARAGLVIHTDARLAERVLAFDDEVRAPFGEPDRRLPGGESAREATARGLAAVADAVASGAACTALVTHGQLLALVLHAIDAGFGFARPGG